MNELSNDQLPISINTSEQLVALFPQSISVCNKLEALFNFHTMTASWYGDEENVLTLNLHLDIPLGFEAQRALLANNKGFEQLADDVFCHDDNSPLIKDIFVALTLAEQEIIEQKAKVLPKLLEIKIRKVLNGFAQSNGLNAI